jgi:hypothetical protein
MVIVIYRKSGGGVWRALCTLKVCTSALLRVATLKGPGNRGGLPKVLKGVGSLRAEDP